MYDVKWEYGADIETTETGDLYSVSGVDLTNQQIIRLTFTTAGGYLQNPTWGVGAPSRIGELMNKATLDSIESAIMSGMRQIPTVAKIPAPTIVLQPNAITGDVLCAVTYYNNQVNQNITISFSLDQ